MSNQEEKQRGSFWKSGLFLTIPLLFVGASLFGYLAHYTIGLVDILGWDEWVPWVAGILGFVLFAAVVGTIDETTSWWTSDVLAFLAVVWFLLVMIGPANRNDPTVVGVADEYLDSLVLPVIRGELDDGDDNPNTNKHYCKDLC